MKIRIVETTLLHTVATHDDICAIATLRLLMWACVCVDFPASSQLWCNLIYFHSVRAWFCQFCYFTFVLFDVVIAAHYGCQIGNDGSFCCWWHKPNYWLPYLLFTVQCVIETKKSSLKSSIEEYTIANITATIWINRPSTLTGLIGCRLWSESFSNIEQHGTSLSRSRKQSAISTNQYYRWRGGIHVECNVNVRLKRLLPTSKHKDTYSVYCEVILNRSNCNWNVHSGDGRSALSAIAIIKSVITIHENLSVMDFYLVPMQFKDWIEVRCRCRRRRHVFVCFCRNGCSFLHKVTHGSDRGVYL